MVVAGGGKKLRKWEEVSQQGLIWLKPLWCAYCTTGFSGHSSLRDISKPLQCGSSCLCLCWDQLKTDHIRMGLLILSKCPNFLLLGVTKSRGACPASYQRSGGFVGRSEPEVGLWSWQLQLAAAPDSARWALFSSPHVWHRFAISSPFIASSLLPLRLPHSCKPPTCAGITQGNTSAKTNAPWPPPTVRRLLG